MLGIVCVREGRKGRGLGGRCWISEIYHWDGQTRKACRRLQHEVCSEVQCFCSNISTVSPNQIHKSTNISTFLLTGGRYSYDLISEFDWAT
jgi:hypothetical protein